MNAKPLVLISCIAALALPASVANGQRRAGGGGRAHVGSMQARSAPSGAYRGTYGNWSGRNWSGRNWSGRNLSGRNWNGRNWSGRNWNGRNWNGDWRRHRNHNHNQFVFFGGFGYPFFYGYPYYGYYPYDYYGYGYDPYGYGYGYDNQYGYGYGYGDRGYGYGDQGYGYGDRNRGGSSVAQLQRRLARAGYYRGAIDGIMGPETRRAIRAYESSRGEVGMR
jgi:hypothetical protein